MFARLFALLGSELNHFPPPQLGRTLSTLNLPRLFFGVCSVTSYPLHSFAARFATQFLRPNSVQSRGSTRHCCQPFCWRT